MADDAPQYARIECPDHGYADHMLGRSGAWVCGRCIEEAGKQRLRENVPAGPTTAPGQPASMQEPALEHFSGEVVTQAREWLSGADTKRGSLLILGPVGTGKTHLACAIGNVLLAKRVPVRVVEARHVLRDFRKAWDAPDGRESEVWNRYIEPRVLVLDDVGAGRASDADKDRVSELLCDRYADAKPTIVVSNLDQKAFRAEVGDRAYSRLRHDGTLIRLIGDDRRKPRE